MELDMEIGEGQPQGCPFFFGGGDGSDDFGESTLPPVPDTGYFPGGSSKLAEEC